MCVPVFHDPVLDSIGLVAWSGRHHAIASKSTLIPLVLSLHLCRVCLEDGVVQRGEPVARRGARTSHTSHHCCLSCALCTFNTLI